MSIHVVLVHPEIHWNTGNAGRTCLAAGATLHLIEPLGFSLDERQVKRAGLDYWPHVDVRTWPSWDAFAEVLPALGTPWLFDEHAERRYWDAPLGETDSIVLVFGRENGGVPASVAEQLAGQGVQIPMTGEVVRSLNLSTSVALGVFEVLRQRERQRPAARR
jgi:tRNA (cytidine/uridine-2'-O-)-methyltransferase